MEIANWAIVVAIVFHGMLLRRTLMNDFTRLFTALEAVAAEASSVASAIRNPAVDNNDQSTIDELASRLENVAETLHAATEAELAEDGTNSKAPAEGGGVTGDAGSNISETDAPSEEAPSEEAPASDGPASEEPAE